MRKNILLIAISIFFLTISCDNDDVKETGIVTFGANYHAINCITNVTVYIDGTELGTLQSPTDEVTECNAPENLSKELTVGNHSYLIEIRTELGTGCNKDIVGSFELDENECEKIFIDYFEIDF